MFKIGLTGGIGSGKSTVSDYFAQLGVPVIDADKITRELVTPGSPALEKIVARFGQGILQPNGELNRPALREHVFADTNERKALEAILHPLARQEIRQQIQCLNAPYCILSIPLLLESGWQDDVDRILVIDAPEELQIQRTAQRDRIDPTAAEAILRSQVDRKTRLAAADDIITNDAGTKELYSQIDRLHGRYLSLAAQIPT